MNSHVGHFDPVFRRMKEKENKFEKCNPFAWSPFMHAICKDKHQTCNMTILEKCPTQNGLSSMNIHEFQDK